MKPAGRANLRACAAYQLLDAARNRPRGIQASLSPPVCRPITSGGTLFLDTFPRREWLWGRRAWVNRNQARLSVVRAGGDPAPRVGRAAPRVGGWCPPWRQRGLCRRAGAASRCSRKRNRVRSTTGTTGFGDRRPHRIARMNSDRACRTSAAGFRRVISGRERGRAPAMPAVGLVREPPQVIGSAACVKAVIRARDSVVGRGRAGHSARGTERFSRFCEEDLRAGPNGYNVDWAKCGSALAGTTDGSRRERHDGGSTVKAKRWESRCVAALPDRLGVARGHHVLRWRSVVGA